MAVSALFSTLAFHSLQARKSWRLRCDGEALSVPCLQLPPAVCWIYIFSSCLAFHQSELRRKTCTPGRRLGSLVWAHIAALNYCQPGLKHLQFSISSLPSVPPLQRKERQDLYNTAGRRLHSRGQKTGQDLERSS
jgi:hypothetical protein